MKSGRMMRRTFRTSPIFLSALIAAIVTGGCAGNGKIGRVVDTTLKGVGIRPTQPQRSPEVPLRIYAGKNLNAGNDQRPVAAVIKIYHLRSAQRFEQAPFNAFLDQAGEHAALGADLLSVNEVVLMPGARQELSEKLSDGTSTVGVVALFRSPAENRWRLSFDATSKGLPDDGITIGVHACALTSDSSALVQKTSGDALSLASIQCGASR